MLGRLGQRGGVERALVVEILLDSGDALGVEVDIAHHMRRQPPLWINAATLVHIADTRNAKIVDGIALLRRHLPLDPGEALGGGELAPQLLGVDIGHGGGEEFHSLVDIDDLGWIGEDRGHCHIGGQQHAIAVDDVGARQRRFGDRTQRPLVLLGEKREVRDLPGNRQEEGGEADADQPQAVLALQPRRGFVV